jgi:hypothetical protein
MSHQEIDSKRRQGVTTAVVATLSDRKENPQGKSPERPPRMELEEIKAELDDEDVGNEVAYLRDAGVVSTETPSEDTVMIKLNPSVTDHTEELINHMYREFDGFVKRLAASDEYLDFEAPNGWPEWEGPERNELAEGLVDYENNMGYLCAVLSIYGEERLQDEDLIQYSVEDIEDEMNLDNQDTDIDAERQLEILEQLGYVERHSKEPLDVYRLADDSEVKRDAERLARFKNDTFSGFPQNMAVAYEEEDRQELEDKGVKLVQRPGKHTQ